MVFFLSSGFFDSGFTGFVENAGFQAVFTDGAVIKHGGLCRAPVEGVDGEDD
jgi:hypothetical protein